MATQRSTQRRRLSPLHFLISILPSAVSAVSLSNFNPSASNLTPYCAEVYTETIPGCSQMDFSGGGGCSASCLQGLVQISTAVYKSCDATKDYQLLIAQFLNGNGIKVLCPGVVVITEQPGTTSPPPPTSFTPEPTSLQGPTTILSSGPVPTSSLIIDTQPPPCVSSTCTDISSSQPTGKPTHTHRTTTSTTHVTSTSEVTRTTTTSNTSRTSQTTKATHSHTHHKKPKQSTTTTSSSSSSSSTVVDAAAAAAAAASARRCIVYGGDPFSNCPSSNSHNAAPSAFLRTSLAAWFSVLSAVICLFLLAVQ